MQIPHATSSRPDLAERCLDGRSDGLQVQDVAHDRAWRHRPRVTGLPPARANPGTGNNLVGLAVGEIMKVEIFSDVACPWCAIGKRRFESALAQFDHAEDVEVRWRSFELDPTAPLRSDADAATHLAHKYGTSPDEARSRLASMASMAAAEGRELNFDTVQRTNTFDAHRLLHYAYEVGVQDALKERLFDAYFSEGETIGDPETLVRLGEQVGLDPEKCAEVLASGRYGDEVRSDERDAHDLGIGGVPFFVIDRHFGISGAQSAEVILDVLNRAWSSNHLSVVVPPTGGQVCDDESCEV